MWNMWNHAWKCAPLSSLTKGIVVWLQDSGTERELLGFCIVIKKIIHEFGSVNFVDEIVCFCFFKHDGFLPRWGLAWRHLFPDRLLATHRSPGHPVEFNQPDDDFENPEAFPAKCAICIGHSANGPWAWCLRLRLVYYPALSLQMCTSRYQC